MGVNFIRLDFSHMNVFECITLKSLQAEQERLTEEQQRLYDERAELKKQGKQIDTIKSNVDSYLSPTALKEQDNQRKSELE